MPENEFKRAILSYLFPNRKANRDAAAVEHPVQPIDPTTGNPFDEDNMPDDTWDRINWADKVIVPIHGYQPLSAFWARVWKEDDRVPYGNTKGLEYCKEVHQGCLTAAGNSLGDEVVFLYPIWPSDELVYANGVRKQAAISGESLGDHLEQLQHEFSDKEIEIIAHSAGGVVAKNALLKLSKSQYGDLEQIRQTLLDVDIPADSFSQPEYRQVAEALHSSHVVHNPDDRALLAAEVIWNWQGENNYSDPYTRETMQRGLPQDVYDRLLREDMKRKILGREGVVGDAPANVYSHQVSLPGTLKHSGHADIDGLVEQGYTATAEEMQDLLDMVTWSFD